MQALEAIEIDEIARHYKQLYRPNGTILGVAGRIDWPQLVDQVGELLGDWEPQAADEPPEGATGPKLDHLAHESNQTQIGIAYESVPYRHPDYFQAWGAVGVLSGGMSSRLFTEVREKRGLCYSVYASYHTLRDRGCVLCYAGTSAERAQETLDVTLGELKRLAQGVRAGGVEPAQGPRQKFAGHAAGIELGPQRRDRPRLVSPGPRANAGRSRAIGRRADLRRASTAIWRSIRPADFTIVTLGPEPLTVGGKAEA